MSNIKIYLNDIIDNLKKLNKEKIIICFAGVINRSIHLTYDNIIMQILKPVSSKYNYDIYVFNNNIENDIIDGVQISNNNLECFKNITFFEEETQTAIDYNIKKTNLKNTYLDYYKNSITAQNCVRQLYCENKVAQFLKNTNYKKAIFITPDFYFYHKLNINSINFDSNNIYISNNNDACGYTNGFYIGNTNLLIKIMERYNYFHKLTKDYEYGVKYACNINNIKRSVLNINFVKIRANKTIRHQNNKKFPIDNYLLNLYNV
jgi:hypothetical protein